MYSLGHCSSVTFKRVPAAAGRRRFVRVHAAPQDSGHRDLGQEAGFLTAVAAVVSVVAPEVAKADEEIDVFDYFIDETISGVNAIRDLIAVIAKFLGVGMDIAQQGYDVIAPVVGETYEKVAPLVEDSVQTLSDAAGPAITAATPTVQDGVKGAEDFLTDQGIDVELLKSGADTAVKTTEGAVTAAKPVAEGIFNFVSSTDPTLLAYEAAGLFALYWLAGPIFKLLVGLLRGYAGQVSPAAALDSISSSNRSFLVDIRTQEDKEMAGAPDLPGGASGRYVELAYAETGSSKLRNQLRSPNDIECQVTAMLIASLKKLDKGSSLYVLDRNGSVAPSIAKELDQRGFKKCYVITGGYNGWKQSKLQIKPSVAVTNAEVIPPVLGTIFGSTSTSTPPPSKLKAAPGRKALPPGK